MKRGPKVITVQDDDIKKRYINGVWDVLVAGYKNVEGGLHFKSKMELIEKTDFWKVICYRGEVIAVTVYKAKKGLKLVALSVGRKFRDIAISALARVVKRDLKQCWMELSEAAEKFVLKLGGDKYIFPNHIAEKLLGKEINLADDGIHYIREIMGVRKEKILLGTVRL